MNSEPGFHHEIKRIMVHIESEDDYEAIDELRSMINGRYSDNIKLPKLFRDRMLIEKLKLLKSSAPEEFKQICSLSLRLRIMQRTLMSATGCLKRKNIRSDGLLQA